MVVLHYMADAITKNIIWNDDLSGREKKKLVKKIMERCSHQEELYLDKDNPRYLQQMYKSIKSGKSGYFYWYVKLGDWKRKRKIDCQAIGKW